MRKRTRLAWLTILVLFSITSALCQEDSAWKNWQWLIGNWTGEGSGAPGQGSGGFSLQPDLDGKILVRKNHSEYPATKDKPAIIHDDLMIVYRDYPGQPDQAIYFDNEGHTIRYGISFSEKSIVLTSTKLQNQPVFRLSYNAIDPGNIGVKFEMSRDGENFVVYTEGKCRRVK